MMCKKILAMVLSFALALSVGFPSSATVSGNDAITFVEEEQELETFEQEPVEEVYGEEEPDLYLAGDSIEDATVIGLDTRYSGAITVNNIVDYYKVNLGSSGRVTITATAMMEHITYIIYDSEGNEIWRRAPSWNNITGQISTAETVDLTKGVYYFVAEQYEDYWGTTYSGSYSFTLSLSGAKESFTETGADNVISKANTIKTNIRYNGQVALNDEKDFYKVTLNSSGEVVIDAIAMIKNITYILYDKDGNEIWSSDYSWNNTIEESHASERIHLTKGTYYFVVERYCDYWGNIYTGNYNFKLSFTDAKESFTETGYGCNNGVNTANVIKVNTNYKGQVAANDEKDFYKLTLKSSGKITVDATAMMEYITYRIYDQEGNEIWNITPSWNNTTGKITTKESVSLIKGTYYFVVERYTNYWGTSYTGNYSFNLKQHFHSYKQKITKATPTKDGKIEKKCSCGAVYSSKKIYSPRKIKLSATEYAYDGKVKKPTVTVKGGDGKVIKSSNYTVTYPKGRKNVGTYKVKVTFKGNYKGTATASFTILPKGTSIASQTESIFR